MAILTPTLIGVSLIFKTGGIRAGVIGAGVKKGPAEKRADTVCITRKLLYNSLVSFPKLFPFLYIISPQRMVAKFIISSHPYGSYIKICSIQF